MTCKVCATNHWLVRANPNYGISGQGSFTLTTSQHLPDHEGPTWDLNGLDPGLDLEGLALQLRIDFHYRSN